MTSVITSSTPIFNKADVMSGRETDALYGEAITIHAQDGEWCDATLTTDGYRGWIKSADLGDAPAPTHHVVVPRTLVTNSPNIKSPHLAYLPLGAMVCAVPSDDGTAELRLANGITGYCPMRHLLPIGEYLDDYVAVAEALISTPYLWGGRDTIGLDCSALVQLSLAATGIKVMRNTGDQEKTIGTDIANIDDLQRGDLVYWKGHIGIMTNSQTLLHANAYHGMVAAEDLRAALPRLHQAAGPITRLARID